PHPAIVTGKDRLRIGWINPDTMHIAVHAAEAAHSGKAFTRVVTYDHGPVSFEKAIGIFRIDDQVGEIKWPPDHPLTFVALVPCAAAIVGNEESTVDRLHESIDAFRIGRR